MVFADGRAQSLAAMLSSETGHTEIELIEWAIAHAALAATWCISARDPVEHPLKVMGVLFEARAGLT